MAFGSNSGRLMSDINVTPFVDVMLVLLIIFMVTAPMMMQGVDVSLPQTTSEPLPSESNDEHLIITINAENKVFINDYRVTLDLLQDKLANILEGRTDREVYLRADRTIPYGIVVRVMAEIKAVGITKLGMVTDPLEEEKKSTDA